MFSVSIRHEKTHQAMKGQSSDSQPPGQTRKRKLDAEILFTLAGTLFSALLLALAAMYAGPLWRDETNTINMAGMSSLGELWDNLPFESFPPLWPLIVRGFCFLGMANSDGGIRVMGLYIGILFLVSLWLCSRWLGNRAPIISVALLGGLPMFIFIAGANRAYGLAGCLFILGFGLLWRLVTRPTRAGIFWTGLVCTLFAHCAYYDVLFLAAILAGAALITIVRRQWKPFGILSGIGLVAGGSMAIYLPVVRRGSVYVPMNQEPFFNVAILWAKFRDAVTARSSAEPANFNGHEVWLWVLLLLGGLAITAALQFRRTRPTPGPAASPGTQINSSADLTLYCATSLVLGLSAYLFFLVRLHYLTQAWYYLLPVCLCAISFDGLLGAITLARRPWTILRIGLMVFLLTWTGRAAWREAHTRRSNVDIIAAILNQKAAPGDLIVVQSSWEGITFDRYYTGAAHWLTIPPIGSHKVHRNDLVVAEMHDPNAMAPVLHQVTDTLRSSNTVWVVGYLSPVRPEELPPPAEMPAIQWGPHIKYWNAQFTDQVRDHALKEQIVDISGNGSVSRLENLPLQRFWGYKPDTN
jgi:hypothetical protein